MEESLDKTQMGALAWELKAASIRAAHFAQIPSLYPRFFGIQHIEDTRKDLKIKYKDMKNDQKAVERAIQENPDNVKNVQIAISEVMSAMSIQVRQHRSSHAFLSTSDYCEMMNTVIGQYFIPQTASCHPALMTDGAPDATSPKSLMRNTESELRRNLLKVFDGIAGMGRSTSRNGMH